MAPSKKRKLRREERKPEPVDLPPTKQEEEEEEQVDYEASEEIHHQQQQQILHQQQQQQEPQEGDEYEDPEEDPDAEDGDGVGGGSDDNENGERREDDEGDEDDEDDDDDEEDIDKLLEPLSKEQLISLLRTAAAFDPRTRAEIRRAADLDPALRRIFVHGISYNTSADTLRSFFSQYGDVDECRIITDRVTGKSKGYGFIVFRHGRSARGALKESQKFIDGRMTACQMATVGPAAASPAPSHQPPPAASSHPQPAPYHTPQDVLPRKIFVGNVNPDVNKERLVQFFSQYGEIEEGPLGFDRQTGKAKGYALFIYKTVEAARRALQEPNKNFDGRLLYCQKATDSQRAKAAAAAAAASGATPTPGPVTPDVQGNMSYNVAPGGAMAFPGAMDMGLAQGFLGAALPFAQGMQANPAAFAMLAAAGQNPAAFGVPPAMIASLNPALAAAAMNQGGAQIVPPAQVPPVQGYSMGGSAGYQNVGYQGPSPQQSGGSYQGPPMPPAMRPTTGPMGGYGPH
ncbi:hypothetical protein Taro_043006 [Colocasia esculenta]|uniref:RRM domain-containing protein n=1 Tax=Colocasia esculenta TaxID=4460 RepID=A0A843WUG1_COLES|nr:hypothetical protein [Colocasia esculenta]